MKHLWLAAMMVAMLPVLALAGDRGDRYRGGRSHYDRGERYEHRGGDSGRRHYDDGGHRHHKSKSRSSFNFSFGFSSGGYHRDSYTSFGYTYSNYPRYYDRRVYVERPVVIVEEPAYCPPAVIYAPPPRVYYYEPVYTNRYHYSGRYSYCR